MDTVLIIEEFTEDDLCALVPRVSVQCTKHNQVGIIVFQRDDEMAQLRFHNIGPFVINPHFGVCKHRDESPNKAHNDLILKILGVSIFATLANQAGLNLFFFSEQTHI